MERAEIGAGQRAAVAGLSRSDVRGPGYARRREPAGFVYVDETGAPIRDGTTLDRIKGLSIPPRWEHVWISPEPLGHVQATGVDSRGRTQYIYHQQWRARRDAEKFQHMLRFAGALPRLRRACLEDLPRSDLDRARVSAAAVRLIDLGLFRIGGERYAELDHHFGATTLEKQHVRFKSGTMVFDYVGKEGKRRVISVGDEALLATVRPLAEARNGVGSLFAFRQDGEWHPLHTHDVTAYIADRSGDHFTAKEFRTWNATVLMALWLASAGPATGERARRRAVAAGIREVADRLGDTPAVCRASYVDPRLIARYQAAGELPEVPPLPCALPAPPSAEAAVLSVLGRGA